MSDESSQQPAPPPGGIPGLTPPPGAPSGLTPPPGIPGPTFLRGSAVNNTAGTTALIAAILNFFCFPVFGAVIGVVMGRMGMNRAKMGLATNGGVAKAGFWLGIAGLAWYALWLLLLVVIAAMSPSSGT